MRGAFTALALLALAPAPTPLAAQEACLSASAMDSAVIRAPGVRRLAAHALPSDYLFLTAELPGRVRATRVVAFSWAAPYDGVLALVDCNGAVVSWLRLGFVERLALARADDGGAITTLVEADLVTGSGTGFRRVERAYLLPDSTELRRTWSGVLREASYVAAEVGAYELEGRVALARDSLHYTLLRYGLAYDPGTDIWSRSGVVQPVDEAVYIWNAREQRFTRQ